MTPVSAMVSIKFSPGKFSRPYECIAHARAFDGDYSLRLFYCDGFHHIEGHLESRAVVCSVLSITSEARVELVLFERLTISLPDKMVGVLFSCFYDII